MADPQLLILDEPTTGLDLGGREIALRALARIGREDRDRTVVLVTHRLEEIPQGFDHVAIMGRLEGSEADAYETNVAGETRNRAPSSTQAILSADSPLNGSAAYSVCSSTSPMSTTGGVPTPSDAASDSPSGQSWFAWRR